MSTPVISAVVPAVLPRSSGGERIDAASLPRRPLPLPSLITGRSTSNVYGLAALDDRGRLADQLIMRTMGWSAGLRLEIRAVNGLLIVHANAHGQIQVTSQGHLRVPALVRHRCGLHPGDRVLLVADPKRGRLVVYPPAALDTLLTLPAHGDHGEGVSP